MVGLDFATVLSTRCSAAGIRPARAGNFSLTRQRKVTKRGALNAIRTRAAACARKLEIGPHPDASRCALAHHLSRAPAIGPSRQLTPAARRAHQEIQNSRVARATLHWFSDEPGVQPRVERSAGAMNPAPDKSCARAQRFASGRNAGGRSRAPLMAASRSCAVQGLFFGDFLLAPQKKVTRPPGRTPGNAASKHALRRPS
jgi:hypothetical protein